MEEKMRLIQQLDDAREALRAALEEIDTKRVIYSDWTTKQVLAHITGWDEVTVAALRAHARGDEIRTPADRGIDAHNAEFVAAREGLSYEQVVRQWELARERFKAAISDMPPEKLEEPMLFPWGATGTVAQVVAIFAEHEVEHAKEIQELNAQVGGG